MLVTMMLLARTRGLRVYAAAALLTASWLCSGSDARAQASGQAALPSAALFPTSTGSATGTASHDALDAAIRAELEELELVHVTARPGLDLEAVQLAIDCVGESSSCLAAVAAQSGVQVVVAPTLELARGERTLRLLRYDAQAGGEPQRAARRLPAGSEDDALLALVPGILRELFGLSRQAPEPTPVASSSVLPPSASGARGEAAPPSAAVSAPRPAGTFPVAPVVVAAAGLAVLGGGIVAGSIMEDTESELAALGAPRDAREAAAAQETRERGKDQELTANLLLGVGAAALAVGGVWLALELGVPDDAAEERATALVPLLAPSQLGLAIVHRGASL